MSPVDAAAEEEEVMAWVTWGCCGEGVGVGGAEAAVAMSADEVDTLRPDSFLSSPCATTLNLPFLLFFCLSVPLSCCVEGGAGGGGSEDATEPSSAAAESEDAAPSLTLPPIILGAG